MCLFLVQENLCVHLNHVTSHAILSILVALDVSMTTAASSMLRTTEKELKQCGQVLISFYIDPSIISIRHRTVINSSNITTRVAMDTGYTLKLVRI